MQVLTHFFLFYNVENSVTSQITYIICIIINKQNVYLRLQKFSISTNEQITLLLYRR